MTPILILGTLFFTIYYLRQHTVGDAAVNIFLPVFLLIPSFYGFRLPHLPGLNFPTAALIPIVVAIVGRHFKDWKFQRTDLWIFFFVAGSYYSELSHSGASNAGLIILEGVYAGILPYILGKMVLEQDGIRERFVRRFALICFVVAVVSLWEFRMGTDLFMMVEGLFLGRGQFLGGQVRNGFMRIAGTFGGSIQAGTIFSMAWLFAMWLGMVDKERGTERKYWGLRRSTILSIGAAGGLLMTLSRGPMIGMAISYLVARIGKAKNMTLASIVTLVLLCVGGTIGYIKAQQYTQGPAQNQDQENAIYRRILLDEYKPYVERGGLFGWGVVDRPVVPGMFSIDNAYLNIQLQQGNLGLWTLLLMGGESLLAAFLAARRATQRSDVFFALCMLGGMAGLLLSMTSVWLGPPMYALFFMMVGWSQSLRQTESVSVMVQQPANTRFAFRRVIA